METLFLPVFRFGGLGPVDIVLGLVIGVSLAASCGFRVFVPLLVMSVAAKAGMLELSAGWEWIGDWPALAAFAIATFVEICAYYVPWLDNLLDAVSSPAAVVAGIIATAACVSDMHPLLQWSAAIIAGGGVAAAVKTTAVLARSTSTAVTWGLGNFVVATFELVMSLLLSVLAIVLPVVAGLVLCLLMCVVGRRLTRKRRQPALVEQK